MATSLVWTRVAVLGCIAIAAFLGSSSSLDAQSQTVLFVANNSTSNGTGCGSSARPCRSISQAIANAASGNLIEVGPGIYGDIDGDGDASSPGEEAVVTIDKGVTVYSAGGAMQTTIRGRRGAPTGTAVVRITAGDFENQATFGQQERGFTIVGDKSGPGEGSVGVAISATSDVFIAGNIASDNGAGGFVVTVPDPLSFRQIALLNNVATRNLFGFGVTVEGSDLRVGVRLVRNVAADNEQQGFVMSGPGRQNLANNLATRNQTGFDVSGSGNLIDGNVAVANVQAGIQTRGPVGSFGANIVTRNTVIGNGNAGFRLLESSDSGSFQRNNIFGNGEAATGCGLINEARTGIDATNNYWGKPNGPGPNPGDRAHGDCVVRGVVVTNPFSSVAFPVEGPNAD